MSLTTPKKTFKPFMYPWAYDAWKAQQQMHWLPEEVPLADDMKDWAKKLTEAERHLITQIFRFFTQSDVEVNNCYHRHYLNFFQPTEVKMMLTAFSSMETVHIAAYSHLLDTLGMPEIEYEAFLHYKEMREKHEYLDAFNPQDKIGMAETMAVFGGLTEGMALFASFAILLNFQRFGKMKGMGQIVAWSVRDETLHCNNIIQLYHTFVSENPDINKEELNRRIRARCIEMIDHEDAFIDLAFEFGAVQGLTAEEVKQYIRYIADRRLTQLKVKTLFDVKVNPLPWLDEILNGVEHVNFFENRATDYSKAATQGEWSDVFDEIGRVAGNVSLDV